MINDWITYILQKGITPNQYYLLWNIQNNTSTILINTAIELRILKNGGWISEGNKLTQKAELFLEDVESTFSKKIKRKQRFQLGEEHADKISEYRELFPKGKKPGTSFYFRNNEKELLTNFSWFFENYPEYGWDVILQATKSHIEGFNGDYSYLQLSKYFIKKQDKNGIITSSLATACDGILDGEEETPDYHINII